MKWMRNEIVFGLFIVIYCYLLDIVLGRYMFKLEKNKIKNVYIIRSFLVDIYFIGFDRGTDFSW